jgi:chromosome segregation ATPase
MDDDEGQVKRLNELVINLQRYIQKQEKMLLDHLRRNIEYELKTEDLSRAVNEFSSKYEESQKQVEIQNEMMQQAANGVESVTIEKQKLENRVSSLENMLSIKKKEYDDVTKKMSEFRNFSDKCKEEKTNLLAELDNLKQEYKRQTEELNNIFKDIEKTKKEKTKSVDEF